MGYDTRFAGQLKFNSDVTVPMLVTLNRIFGETCREHPEWKPETFGDHLYYVDLIFLPDFSGVQFNCEAESTSLGPEMINMITAVMRESHPESGFAFKGEMLAQGEDIEDRWFLIVDGDEGEARRGMCPPAGQRITCPHCEREFILDECDWGKETRNE